MRKLTKVYRFFRNGTHTKRPGTERTVTKRPVTKRPVTKRPVYRSTVSAYFFHEIRLDRVCMPIYASTFSVYVSVFLPACLSSLSVWMTNDNLSKHRPTWQAPADPSARLSLNLPRFFACQLAYNLKTNLLFVSHIACLRIIAHQHACYIYTSLLVRLSYSLSSSHRPSACLLHLNQSAWLSHNMPLFV